MSDRFDPVKTNQYLKISQQWTSFLKMKESVCVIFPYLSDRQFRIKQYVDSLENSELFPIIISPVLQTIDEPEDLKNLINQQLPNNLKKDTLEKSLLNQKITIVLVITEGELLIKPEYEFLLDIFQDISLSFQNIKVLIAFDSDIFRIIPNFSKYNLLFQNIIYYHLYSDNDIMFFIEYLCQKWQMKMPQPIRKSITYNSGGFFWLAKEACRVYRNTNTWSPDSPSFQFRLNSIIKALSLTEKEIISACPYLKGFESSDELKHLKKISLIKKDNSVSVPKLASLIIKNKEKNKIFEIENGEITLKGFPLSRILSVTEYTLLKHFVSKPNNAITRDEISKILWPKNPEENYSEWAIDQAVKRLRDRLVSLKLSPTIIKSIRGIGYEFRI